MTILVDPIFQLNLVLWLLEAVPGEASIRPVLREHGYVLESLGRPLLVPTATRPVLMELTGSATPASLDVLAAPPPAGHWLVFECKSRSFGPASATARQAVKVLAVAADVGPSIGMSTAEGRQPGFVVYVTGAQDCEAMALTLAELGMHLADKGLTPARAGALGIHQEADGLYVSRAQQSEWPAPLTNTFVSPVRVMRLAPEEDPRPLYLIPFDPSVDQQPEQRAYSLAVLSARLASHAIAAVGRANVPSRLVLRADRLLSEATFGAADRWRSKPDAAKALRRCKDLLYQELKPVSQECQLVAPSDPERVELTITDNRMQARVLDALQRINPSAEPVSTPGPVEDVDQLSLFDVAGDRRRRDPTDAVDPKLG